MIDLGDGSVETPLIDATNAKIDDPNYDCSTLKDPAWALQDDVYRYAPPEPEKVDWSKYVPPLNLGGGNDFDGAQGSVPAPGPTGNGDGSSPSLNYVYVSEASDGRSPTTNGEGGEEEGSDCPLQYTGYYATAGCKGYVQCQDGQVLGGSLPCVPGTLFDMTVGVRAWEAQVQCRS